MSGGMSDLMKSNRIGYNIERMTDALVVYLSTGDESDYERFEEVVDHYEENRKCGYYGESSGSVARRLKRKFVDDKDGFEVMRSDIGEFLFMLRENKKIESLAYIFSLREDAGFLDLSDIYDSKRSDRVQDWDLVQKWIDELKDYNIGNTEGEIPMDEVERFIDDHDIDVWYDEE